MSATTPLVAADGQGAEGKDDEAMQYFIRLTKIAQAKIHSLRVDQITTHALGNTLTSTLASPGSG